MAEVPRSRDQRAGILESGPLHVHDRRLTVARLLLFGPAREAAGVSSVILPGHDVAGIIAAAEERFGEAFVRVLATSHVWLNGEVVESDATVSENDEVAVIPPVSGG